MTTIANQNGRHMVQHVLLPVNIHFHWNLFIFEFLTIYLDFFNFYIGSHFVLPIPIFLANLVPLDVESKMAAKIQKSSDLGKIWFPSRLWCCELISIIWEPYYDPSDHIASCYYYSFSSFFLPSKVCPTHFSEMPCSNFMKPCRSLT
jgi:hypothetical protein